MAEKYDFVRISRAGLDAAEAGVTRQTVNQVIEELQKNDIWQKFAILSEYREPDWTPPIYNAWKLQTPTAGNAPECPTTGAMAAGVLFRCKIVVAA